MMKIFSGKQRVRFQSSVIAIAVFLCISLAGGGFGGGFGRGFGGGIAQWPTQQTFVTMFTPGAGPKNVMVSEDGQQVALVLDPLSAAGFESKNRYLFGNYGAKIKLVPDNSAGTVTTFYLSSQGTTHDEFDFEFLGNSSGQPYILHTNIFSNGEGDREQQFSLWFDPTADFHFYQFRWNKDLVLFYVDDIPIRMFKNNEAMGLPFPNKQPMGVYTSIWDGSVWATQGGRVKIDWTAAPFVATFQNFDLKGCTVIGRTTVEICQQSKFASPGPGSETLSQHQIDQLEWVRSRHLTYNYCSDRKRFPVQPLECMTNII